MARQKYGTCEICGRPERLLTFHHFIPRKCHRNKWFRKTYAKAEMKQNGAYLCLQCHRFIHQTHNEKELGKNFNSRRKLLSDPRIRKFVSWVKKQR